MDLEIARIKSKLLMIEHGILQKGWDIDFKSRRLPGNCIFRDKMLLLSKQMVELNDWDKIKHTVLHEICHVLAPPTWDGWSRRWSKHHRAFQLACISVGTRPDRCLDADKEGITLKSKKPAKYTFTCSCGIKHEASKRGKHFNRYHCKHCKDKLVFTPNLSYSG